MVRSVLYLLICWVLAGCASLYENKPLDAQDLRAGIAQMAGQLDRRPVLYDSESRAYQFEFQEDSVRLYRAGTDDDAIGTVRFDRSIAAIKGQASNPGLEYLPSKRDTIVAWFHDTGQTTLLLFSLRPGEQRSQAIAFDGHIRPVFLNDGSVAGFASKPWRIWFDLAHATENGFSRGAPYELRPKGIPTSELGSVSVTASGEKLHTIGFGNWSDNGFNYVTLVSSDRSIKVVTMPDVYTPVALLPSDELLLLDASACDIGKKDASIRSEAPAALCSAVIVAVKIADSNGPIDIATKRVIQSFTAPEILLATSSSAGIRGSDSMALVGDMLFSVSRKKAEPILRWVSVSEPTRRGRVPLGTGIADDITVLHRDQAAGRLELTTIGPLNPYRFIGVETRKENAPTVSGSIAVRKPSFDGSRYTTHYIDTPAKAPPYLLTGPRGESDAAPRCHGKAIVTAYGGYGSPTTAEYLTTYGPYWLDRGNSYVTVYPRGGGDLGEAWFQEGTGTQFEASVDDVVAAIRDLHARGCRSVALSGFSHGGNVVTLAALRVPELVDQVVISAAPLDLARGLLEPTFNTSIYPRRKEGEDESAAMAKMSPVAALAEAGASNMPHFLLFYGGRDGIVPAYHGEAFADVARKRGFAVDLIVYPDMGHEPPNTVETYADQMSRILTFVAP